MRDVCLLVARLLIAPMFFMSGLSKAMEWPGVVDAVASQGIPMPLVAGALATAVEIAGAVLIVLGLLTRWAALALAAFTAVASYYFHAFWAMPEAEQGMQQIMFMKNVAVIGGLLALAGAGPGRIALGR